MWRQKILTISLGIAGALVIGTFGPWGQGSNNHVEIPTASASSFQVEILTGAGTGSTQLAAVVPPYIILGDMLDQGAPTFQQPEIRVSMDNMAGFYSEARASLLANTQPVMLASSSRLSGFGDSSLHYAD